MNPSIRYGYDAFDVFGYLGLILVLPIAASAQPNGPAHGRDQGIGAGSELVMVYIGVSHCGPCTRPEDKTALEQKKLLLAEQAVANGKTFVAVGPSTDFGTDEGYELLKSSGGFDELVIGRSWYNSAALTYLWRRDGLAKRTVGLPNVLVFERDMEMGALIGASEPRYLKYVVGATDLPDWVAAGALLADVP